MWVNVIKQAELWGMLFILRDYLDYIIPPILRLRLQTPDHSHHIKKLSVSVLSVCLSGDARISGVWLLKHLSVIKPLAPVTPECPDHVCPNRSCVPYSTFHDTNRCKANLQKILVSALYKSFYSTFLKLCIFFKTFLV